MDGQRTELDPLAGGWGALRAGEWQGARACFERAIESNESPEAFEGLGWAAYCQDDDLLTIRARERAYRLYRERGDDEAAARLAAWLAADWAEFRGEHAVCNGWLQRAHRLLDGREPCADHGWLAVHEASMIIDDDPATARRLGTQAAELGRRFGVVELEMLGMAIEGRSLVGDGDLVEGMRRLDEATVLALSGEAELLSCVAWACCYLISACEQVRDYDRAGQWCRQVGEFCEQHGIELLLGMCRAKYAGVLTWQGRWQEAESEAKLATEGLTASRPPLVGEALVRLAELRRLQGRLDEAEDLFTRCQGDPRALLGRAALALDRRCPDAAAELAERFLRRYVGPQRIERAPGLEVAVRAYAELGEPERAREALDNLRQLAARVGTRPLRAALLIAEAKLASADGDQASARQFLEDAVDALAGNAGYEIGRARVDLAAVLAGDGRIKDARLQIETALVDLRQLGARGEVARAEALLERLAPVKQPGRGTGPMSGLSPRERQILTLVAEGLTNHQIAERLVLSEHTVHRHVTSILRKLGLPSRAAAAAAAARHGLA
ncbi:MULTISPECIES: LuxR C-terminal-related transcriptional regulator [unclassified Kribbella]|uniref:LuxR C-terminal-related transcriptional regulator n=1 Tax=unclassified Kribbella TaxID=2644121 RepID=UPI0033E8AD6B